MEILAIDLGKFSCVSCLFDTETNTTEFETIKTCRIEFEGLLNDPSQEAWRWKNVKRNYVSGISTELARKHGQI